MRLMQAWAYVSGGGVRPPQSVTELPVAPGMSALDVAVDMLSRLGGELVRLPSAPCSLNNTDRRGGVDAGAVARRLQLESASLRPYLHRTTTLLVRELRAPAGGHDDAALALASRLTTHLARCVVDGAGATAATTATLRLAAEGARSSTHALVALAAALREALGGGLDTPLRAYDATCHALATVATLLDQCERGGWMGETAAAGAADWFRLQHQAAGAGDLVAGACARLSARILGALTMLHPHAAASRVAPAADALLRPLLAVPP